MNTLHIIVTTLFLNTLYCQQLSLNTIFLKNQQQTRDLYLQELNTLEKEYTKKREALPCSSYLLDPSPVSSPVNNTFACLDQTSFPKPSTPMPLPKLQDMLRDIQVLITTIAMDKHMLKHSQKIIEHLPARSLKFIRNNVITFPTISSKSDNYTLYRISLQELYRKGILPEDFLKNANHQPLWIIIKKDYLK